MGGLPPTRLSLEAPSVRALEPEMSIPLQAEMPPGQTKSQRRTIGFIIDGIFGQGGYQSELLKGVWDTAQAENLNLVCFTGGPLRNLPDPDYDYQRNLVYTLATEQSVDGLILHSATIAYIVGKEEFSRYFNRLHSLPMINLGFPLEGIPNLLIDNATGTRQVVAHLIEAHGLRRIAYIRGPQINYEAEIRYAVYRQTLEDHGLAYDPDLVVEGDFRRQGGERAIRELVDERRVTFDGLVAANDAMALGALMALRERGVLVPWQVRLAGYDNIEDAAHAFPSLTTVRQPIYSLGARAVLRLIQRMAGETLPDEELLPTELVIRGSCGCAPLQISSGELLPGREPLAPISAEEGRRQAVERMLAALECPPALREQARMEARQLLDLILEETTPTDAALPGRLFTILERSLELPWHRAILALAGDFLAGADQGTFPAAQSPSFWLWLGWLVSEAEWLQLNTRQIREKYRKEREAEQLRRINQALGTAFNLSELMNALRRFLPDLGFHHCWVSLFEMPNEPPEWVRLMLAYAREETSSAEVGQRYPARWLLPRPLLETSEEPLQLFVNALYFREKAFGFVVWGMDDPDQTIFEMIASQIGTALQGAWFVNQLRHAEAELRRQANTDALTGLFNRRHLFTLAEPMFDLALRHRRPFSVAMIDLDRFKLVNDRYGHLAGDRVLKAFAAFLQVSIRGTDLLGRYGGEEFLIIMPETSLEGAYQAVERLRRQIAESSFPAADQPIKLTASIGVAGIDYAQDTDLPRLIEKADRALYRAKGNGRNQVAVYNPAEDQPPS